MTALVQAVMGLIDRHPNWVSLITFLTAMSEAVAVVGLFIPGTISIKNKKGQNSSRL